MFSKLCLCSISLIITFSASRGSSQEESTSTAGTLYGYIPGLNDFIPRDDKVFLLQPVTSQLECLRMCMEHCTCWLFTHTVRSSGQMCTGVSFSTTIWDASPASGSKSFAGLKSVETDWLETSCTVGEWYPESDSLCPETGRLLCSPGFYYSVSTNTCVKDCQTCALRNEVMEHNGYGIVGHVDSAQTGLTAAACSAGLVDSAYPTATYNATSGTCHSHRLTYNDVETSEQISGNLEMTFFQRKCA